MAGARAVLGEGRVAGTVQWVGGPAGGEGRTEMLLLVGCIKGATPRPRGPDSSPTGSLPLKLLFSRSERVGGGRLQPPLR